MFCAPYEEDQSQKSGNNRRNSRKRNNKRFKNIKKELSKKKYKFAVSMTSWAESFTVAATWQLKHELAYWKAKAKSLEYENQVLHDVIRKNCYDSHADVEADHKSSSESDTEEPNDPVIEDDVGVCSETEENDDDFEVSEEYIKFLQINAKYKEDARRERERLRAKYADENIVEQMEAGPSEPKDKKVDLKELYGENWEKIAALESYVQANFIKTSDSLKPMHWPNIPFNFNFS